MKHYKVIGIGELLWDLLPEGKQLGGAPSNFAVFSSQFGTESFVVSSIGQDSWGREILDYFESHGLKTNYISMVDKPTGVVNVQLDEKGVPQYDIVTDVAWDYIPWQSGLEHLAKQADAICFGSLSQRNACSAETIRKFVGHANPDCLMIFDINLRQNFYTQELVVESLRLANILKVNEDEFEMLSDWLDLSGSTIDKLGQLQKKFQLDVVALTRGENGSMLASQNEIVSCPAQKVDVADTVGAGDAFTAAMTIGLLNKLPLETINQIANKVGAYVCSQSGATPLLPENFLY